MTQFTSCVSIAQNMDPFQLRVISFYGLDNMTLAVTMALLIITFHLLHVCEIAEPSSMLLHNQVFCGV